MLTAFTLQAEGARHVPIDIGSYHHPYVICPTCRLRWPCPANEIIEELWVYRAAAAVSS